MYCGTCLHDNTLAAALLKAGHDVLLVPAYTPLRTDEENVSDSHVFFGGINVYLQQKLTLFRHTPRFIDALLDSWPFMKWLSKRRATVDPTKLGDLTVSMLQGRDGKQVKELRRLVAFLANEVRPDVVHLSNAMLVAMASDIRSALGVPVVCSLAGEDVFLERLIEPYHSQARESLRKHAGECAAYVALNRYYADFMIDYMGLDPQRVHVIPHGLNLAGYETPAGAEQAAEGVDENAAATAAECARPQTSAQQGHHEGSVTIGYFARVCHDKGFHLLAEAFRLLCQEPGLPPLLLRTAGYVSSGDKAYQAEVESRLARWGLADRYQYLGEPDRAGKIALLRSFDILCVPTVYQESKGLSVLEALAVGVPVVLPAHGAFPEVVADTGGGLLFEPHNPHDIARRLKELIVDAAQRRALGQRGRQAVFDRYNSGTMARRTAELYRQVIGGQREHARPQAALREAAE